MSKICFILICYFKISTALYCYNCSSTNHEWSGCEGDFVPSILIFNNTRNYLINCTGDNAMCFVRSWSARARHSWIVQRGCYQPSNDDPLPRSMTTPTRAMSCKNDRLAEAEYKVCLCKADWCNSASSIQPYNIVSLPKIIKPVITYVNNVYRYIILIK